MLYLFLLFAFIDLKGQNTQLIDSINSKQGHSRREFIMSHFDRLLNSDKELATHYGEEVRTSFNDYPIASTLQCDFLLDLGYAYDGLSINDSVRSIILSMISMKDIDQGCLHKASLLGIELIKEETEYKKALPRLQEALVYFRSVNNREYEAQTYRRIGVIHFHLGNFDEGILAAREGLKVIKDMNLDVLEGHLMLVESHMYRSKGEVDTAYEGAKLALNLFESSDYILGIAKASNLLGILEARRGNLDSSLDYFIKARNIHEAFSNKESRLEVLNNIALIHKMKGEYEEAAIIYRDVVELSEGLERKSTLALALGNLGVVYADLKKYEEAIVTQEKCKILFEELGDKIGTARTLNNLGSFAMALGRFDDALQYLLKSLSIKEEIGAKMTIGQTLHNIGDLYRMKEEYDSASKYLEEALIAKKVVQNRISLAHTYFTFSQLKNEQGFTEQAVLYADSALGIEDNELTFLRDLHEYRSGLYEKLGQYEKALATYKDFKGANDSLFSTENESVIAQIQAQFKTKEQHQQIELLNQKRQNQQLWMAGLIGGVVLLTLLVGVSYNRYRLKAKASRIIQEKSEALEQSNKELKELSDFKQGMTNMIAHDIKTPLTAILNLSFMSKEENAKTIAKAGESILRLVSNMLDVEKFEHAKPELTLKKVLLSELIDEAKLAVHLLLHDKSITLMVNSKQDVYLKVDQDMMVRVLINLFSNAIKFSPSNEEIVVETNVSSTDGNYYVEIEILDHGPGIPPEHLPNLFEKFYQAKARNLGLTQSTGLGLTFCKMAIAAHNGNISVKSEENHGSTFIIQLEVEELGGRREESGNSVSTLMLSKNDLVVLKSYSPHLKALKVFNVGSIMKILDEIDDLGLDSKWTDHLRSAVKYSNEQQYDELIKIIDDEQP